MERTRIYSQRKGSVQWNEEDRLALASLLIKTGYAVKIGRAPVPGTQERKNIQHEYFVEYWKEDADA